MICSPRVGQLVRIHYARRYQAHMPYHGMKGKVMRTSPPGARPRNHLIAIFLDRRLVKVMVPCGNLMPAEPNTPTKGSRCEYSPKDDRLRAQAGARNAQRRKPPR